MSDTNNGSNNGRPTFKDLYDAVIRIDDKTEDIVAYQAKCAEKHNSTERRLDSIDRELKPLSSMKTKAAVVPVVVLFMFSAIAGLIKVIEWLRS